MIPEHWLRVPEESWQHGQVGDGHFRGRRELEKGIRGRVLRAMSKRHSVHRGGRKAWSGAHMAAIKEASSIAEQIEGTEILKEKGHGSLGSSECFIPGCHWSQEWWGMRMSHRIWGHECEQPQLCLHGQWQCNEYMRVAWPVKDLTPVLQNKHSPIPSRVSTLYKQSLTPLFPAKPTLDFADEWTINLSNKQTKQKKIDK